MQLDLDVTLDFDEFSLRAKQAISLPGITGLIGDSGSGKTTLLRVIAGLEQNARGLVRFEKTIWQNQRMFIKPDRRKVSMVFQDLRLFEHLSVHNNLQYAVKRNRGEIKKDDVIEALDLMSLLNRIPASLSGGEKQRAAIGRSLLSQPSLLLMDEPLTGLNAQRKQEILPYIRQLPSAFSLPVFYVSHNIDEISQLCDNVYSMVNGQLQTASSQIPEQLSTPGNTELSVSVLHHDPEQQQTLVGIGSETLILNKRIESSEQIQVCIHPDDVIISLTEPRHLSTPNVKPAAVTAITESQQTDISLVTLQFGDVKITASLTGHARKTLNIHVGQSIFAIITRIQVR